MLIFFNCQKCIHAMWTCNQFSCSWCGTLPSCFHWLSQRSVESTQNRPTCKLLCHFLAQCSSVCLQSCEDSLPILKPMNDFMWRFGSIFQNFKDKIDFCPFDISWVANEINLSKIFFLVHGRSLWDQWKHRLPVCSKFFAHGDLNGWMKLRFFCFVPTQGFVVWCQNALH